jgi:hypothetical protein
MGAGGRRPTNKYIYIYIVVKIVSFLRSVFGPERERERESR